MDAIILNISGNWAHFRKVDTNNNPLTHDFITKTALIGLIGAINGIDRVKMKGLFPILSEDLLYGVALKNHVVKETWGFTLRSTKVNLEKSPWQFEFLKAPNFEVVVALKNERSRSIFDEFVSNVENNMAHYNPTLGLANCPADIYFISTAFASEKQTGAFTTKGFISNFHQIEINPNFDFRIGFDKMPTFQNDDFWNDPEKYLGVAYSYSEDGINVKSGNYYNVQNQNEISQWFLI